MWKYKILPPGINALNTLPVHTAHIICKQYVD